MTVPNAGATAAPNVFNIRSLNDFVAMLYVLLPVATPIILSYGIWNDEHVLLWVGVATQVFQLVLQWVRTQDFARRVIYTALNLVASVLVIYKGLEPDFLNTWMPLIVLILGAPPAAIAVQNVNTTGDNVVPLHRSTPPDTRAA